MSDNGAGQQRDGQGCDVCRARILHSGVTEFCCEKEKDDTQSEDLMRGDLVVLPTRYGGDLAVVQGHIQNRQQTEGHDVVKIKRRATKGDVRRHLGNEEKERLAFEACTRLIAQHGLAMKLVKAHHLLDEPKILFFFTAEERVDFRNLVRDLVEEFQTRIELRQIGVRDEARIVGGVGVCARPFCCSSITDKLRPVSIKMAKEQNLTLNSMKISGPCGRLLCCLAYEYEAYREAHRGLPKVGAEVHHGGEHFRVREVNVVSERIRLTSQSGRVVDLEFSQIAFDEQERRWMSTQVDLDEEQDR